MTPTPSKYRNRRTETSEWKEQKTLFEWAKARSATLPELKLLFHIPNGGQRSIITAKRMKDSGTKRGVPDLMLPVARRGWHGLFIELKAGKNTVTDDQSLWLNALRFNGYCAAVCYGWQEASNLILRYLEEME